MFREIYKVVNYCKVFYFIKNVVWTGNRWMNILALCMNKFQNYKVIHFLSASYTIKEEM